MTSRLVAEVAGGSLDRVGADVAAAGVFHDERPLRGGAGFADWRLCGWLSELAGRGRLGGEAGECALVPTHGRLEAPRLLLVGLGARGAFGAEELRAAVALAVERALALGAGSLALDLPPSRPVAPLERWGQAVLAGALRPLEGAERSLVLRVVVAPGRVRAAFASLERAASVSARGPSPVAVRVVPGGAPKPGEAPPAGAEPSQRV